MSHPDDDDEPRRQFATRRASQLRSICQRLEHAAHELETDPPLFGTAAAIELESRVRVARIDLEDIEGDLCE